MNLLLISDDEILAKQVAGKLVFLRKDDNVLLSSYDDASRNIKISNPDVILVHENLSKQRTVDTISQIHKMPNVSVILLADSYESDLILASADVGADDFILSTADDFELVVRIINNIKRSSVMSMFSRNNLLLEQVKVVDVLTGLYSYEYSKQVIENYIDNNLITSGIFMALSPSNDAKQFFDAEDFAKAVKSSIRANDIVTLGRGINLYVFMPDTDLNGAIVVLNKIKESVKFAVCAGICEISGRSYSEFEDMALKVLADAVAVNSDFKFAEEIAENNLLEELTEGENVKNYKLFRQMYNKKLEKVIVPVFYGLQKTYEDKLFDTTIYQCADDKKCIFQLKNKDFESSLCILYSGFSKVFVDIKHDGLDSPENVRMQLQLSKINQKTLTKIVEDFIKEFKNRG